MKENKCQYKSKEVPRYCCKDPALPDSKNGYCIFHEKEKDNQLFEERIKEKVEKGDYDFTGYYFPSRADLRGIVFNGRACFSGAIFGSEAYFNRVTFTNDAIFSGATFQGNVHFERTTFERLAAFRSVTFEQVVWFEGAVFEEVTLFQNAIFKDETHFWGTCIKRIIDFRGAVFKYPEDKQIAFRLSKIAYQREGWYDKAGDAYYNERIAGWECLKWWPFRSCFKKLIELILLRLTCGYGERPCFVFGWTSGIIVLFSVLYYKIGHIKSVSPEDIFTIGDAIYFSAVTFATLGFGGPWFPCSNHWVKYFVMTEALLGAFFMALFVMTFGRRMMR